MNNFQNYDARSKFYLHKPLGEILIEAGLISIHQIGIALQEQQSNNLRIGDILVDKGWIKRQTVDFFADRWIEILQQKSPKQSLVFYFRESGLLTSQQVKKLVELQKQARKKKRFYYVAIEQGYLEKATVDFFLTYLFNIHNTARLSYNKPYKILQEYIKGETNFTNSELSKSSFQSFNLKEITLDGSSLREADLSNCNFSYSSLVRVNISRADLSKVILTGVNLERSLAIETNFREAHLEKTNFFGANLQGADFRDAYLSQASFSFADLTGIKLAEEYPYPVYYDRHTRFDADFDPQGRGWKIRS